MSSELTKLNPPQRVAFANQLAGQINEALDRAWKTAVVLGWELTRLKAELPHGEFGKLFENDSKSELWFRFSSRQARKYMELYTLCCEKAGQLGQAEALQALLGAIHPAQSYRALPTPGGEAAPSLPSAGRRLVGFLHTLAPEAHSMRQAMFTFMTEAGEEKKPAGATFVTTSNIDGSTARVYGTGQRELVYSYDLNGTNRRTTLRNAAGDIVSQSITNGFGQTIVQAKPNTLGGFIYTRNEYNAKGQLVKQYQDTGLNTEKTAPTLYEYDSFGNQLKQVLALSDTPTKDNSPVREMAYSVESAEDGVYSVTTQTRYNAAGEPLSTTQKQLISQLSATLASKSISIDMRGNSSVNWSEYTAPTKVSSFSTVPTSNITAESISIDGFTISQKDHAGIITTASRSYTATGMTMVNVDGRNNATTIHSDLAGRTISVTDAANATTTTAYDTNHNQPAVVTDAMGNTSCYKYDARGRKIAEWGTALQPACFGYDDMDNMTTLRTFRADNEVITTDPSERTDGDVTTWAFNPVTGLEISKTYADNTTVVKTYDAYNRLATETDARGNVKTHAYEHARGLHLGTSYTVVEGIAETSARSFTYNHLGQMTQLVDYSGTRTFTYNTYGEREADSLAVGGDTHLITEARDSFGRSTGYVYRKNGTVQHTVTTGYGTDGRISSAGFTHGGAVKQFGYEYLNGTNLLHKLTKPNNMTLTQTYEATRDLLTGMDYHRGTTLIAQRTYSYDILGRPTARNTARNGQTMNDTFAHNNRSELVSATVNNMEYEYAYDNIGNRQQATEGNDITVYDANELNQYTAISENGASAFVPQFDADGNQTLIKTETGIWSAVYNAENRPVTFTNSESNTIVECQYDSMGRRAYKKVTTNGSVTLHQRYIYRGYLQIACVDLTRNHHPLLWLITWDPLQSISTRPLAIQKDGTWYTYGIDLTKNVCEVFGSTGYITTTYTYSPYGSVTASGNVSQPILWSSEVSDGEIGLVYYNWRYYNSHLGRWMARDIEKQMNNQYVYGCNSGVFTVDQLGNFVWMIIPIVFIAAIPSCTNTPNNVSNPAPYTKTKLSSKEKSRYAGFCGNYTIKEEWNLTPPPGVSGVISQHIEYKATIDFMQDNRVITLKEDELFGSFKSYTEYWSVLSNWNNATANKFFTYNRVNIDYVDKFEFDSKKAGTGVEAAFNCSKGSISLKAEAQFIPNEVIPSTASQKQDSPPSALPFMIGRHLKNNVTTYKRTLSVNWNCMPNTNIADRKVKLNFTKN